MKKAFFAALPHATLVLCGMLAVFTVLDGYNPGMGFLTGDLSHGVLLACCLCAALTAGRLVRAQRRE